MGTIRRVNVEFFLGGGVAFLSLLELPSRCAVFQMEVWRKGGVRDEAMMNGPR